MRFDGLIRHRQPENQGLQQIRGTTKNLLQSWGRGVKYCAGYISDLRRTIVRICNYARAYGEFANWQRLRLSAHPSESQLIVPSLLHLASSSIARTIHIPPSELQYDEMDPASSVSSPAVSYQPSTNHSVSAPSPETSHSPGDQLPIDQPPIPSHESPEPRIAPRPAAEIRHIGPYCGILWPILRGRAHRGSRIGYLYHHHCRRPIRQQLKTQMILLLMTETHERQQCRPDL